MTHHGIRGRGELLMRSISDPHRNQGGWKHQDNIFTMPKQNKKQKLSAEKSVVSEIILQNRKKKLRHF